MTESDNPYQPISCTFHDRLEDWAIRRSPVLIRWRENGEEQFATAKIEDVYASEGADYIRLDSGEVIRLNWLVSVDGVPLPGDC